MKQYPDSAVDLDALMGGQVRLPAGVHMLTQTLPDGLVVHANVAVRESSDHIVVFLPGAQSAKSERRMPFFHRWTWQADVPWAHVIALGDPAIALDDRILGGWFMHPQHDLVALLATFVDRVAEHLGIHPARVTFHGSSLGGFGAIGMAAHLPGSSAVAEIPQIDVELWPFPQPLELLGEVLGKPLAEFRIEHPERVDLLDRLAYAAVIPPFTVVTSAYDKSYALHLAFIADVASLSSTSVALGTHDLVVTDVVLGHKPLPKERALEYLRARASSSSPDGPA